MALEQILGIARDRISIELGVAGDALERRITQIKGEMNKRGVLHSGMTVSAIGRACGESGETSGAIAWETIHRTLATAGVGYSDDLPGRLKEELSARIVEVGQHVEGAARAGVAFLGDGRMAVESAKIAATGVSLALRRALNEVDLYIAHLQRPSKVPTDSGAAPTVINNYAPVASIQTGSHAIANIRQALDGPERQRLSDALAEIAGAMERLEAPLAAQQQAESLELVRDAQAEVVKERPNGSKLRALLTGIRDAVQTAADLKDASPAFSEALRYLTDLLSR